MDNSSSSIIKGKAFVLGKNVDTDQIIPAQHLVYSLDDPEERKYYGTYALSGVPDEESGLPNGNISLVDEDAFQSKYSIIVAGPNFGCGSSREHAPASLQIAGIKAIIAPTDARIFYRNSVDGGFVIPYESLEDLSSQVKTGDELIINPDVQLVENWTQGQAHRIRKLGSVAEIVQSGGIFHYARKEGMV